MWAEVQASSNGVLSVNGEGGQLRSDCVVVSLQINMQQRLDPCNGALPGTSSHMPLGHFLTYLHRENKVLWCLNGGLNDGRWGVATSSKGRWVGRRVSGGVDAWWIRSRESSS